MKKNISSVYIFVCITAILTLGLSGCSSLQAKPSALSNEEVTAATEEILTSIDEGDYETFSADMSEVMVEAFTVTEFENMQSMLSEASGEFVSCGDPTLVNQEEFAVYRVPCEYENEDVTVTIVYDIDGEVIQGLFFDSPGLRAQSE